MPGVDLVLITDRPQIDRVRDLVASGNSIQMADPAFMRELKSWLRFNQKRSIRQDRYTNALGGIRHISDLAYI